jgi:hypothetical protein
MKRKKIPLQIGQSNCGTNSLQRHMQPSPVKREESNYKGGELKGLVSVGKNRLRMQGSKKRRMKFSEMK